MEDAVPAFAGKTGHAYITKLLTPIPGYLVAVPDNAGQKYRRKAFRSKTRPADELLAAAVAWRDRQLAGATGQAMPPVRVFHKRQRNGKTGIPGVRKITKVIKKRTRDGTVRQYRIDCILAVVWLTPGKAGRPPRDARSKVFSLNKYTQADALALAAAWRAEQEAILAHCPPAAQSACDISSDQATTFRS
ncbi:hypothetical protein RCH09_003609 [Actimicrobium sp. GrIS 1.19]|uniref:hypothetical protein n=1 Tax=Actimicrobium sp. GrIS 1.19 TaxID=3071708 RepID=UPI002E05C796|nr:hypothetical protein [Actimicrobium sp. GrIS 1.19]